MTNLTRSITTLGALTAAIDAHDHKDELISIINSQIEDDTYIVEKDAVIKWNASQLSCLMINI